MKQYILGMSPRLEFAIVVLGAFGFFILGSVFAAFSANTPAPISDAQLRSLIVYEPVVAFVLLAFLRIRQWNLQSFGLKPSGRDTLIGIGLAVAAYLAYIVVFLVAALVSPFVARVTSNETLVAPGLSLALIVAVSIINPIFEEFFVAGYIITVLKERGGFWTALNVSIAVRLLYHLYQGPIGVLSIIPLGFVFAYWYGRTGRLWPLIVAHALFDLLGLSAAS